jgi:hypothetical protein
MNKFFLALLLTFMSFSALSAQGVQGLSSSQAVELPMDADRMYLTLFDDDSEESDAVQGWLDGSLLGLRQHTRYQRIHCGTPMYHQRYATDNQGVALRLQAPNGDDVCVVHRDEIPMTDAALKERIKEDCQRWRLRNCPDGRCRPQTEPKQEPEQDDPPVAPLPRPQPTPIKPSPTPRETSPMDIPIWLMILVPLVGAVVGVGLSYHEQYKGR